MESGYSTTRGIKVKQFIDQCQALDVFNVLSIREVAKRTNVMQENQINLSGERDSNLSRDLFGGRLSEEELNGGGIEDDLTDIPNGFSDAVLYRVVQTIDSQLK